LKSFEIARLEHIHCLNETCIEINKELVQKLCTFVTGRMEHLDSSYQVLHGIEKQINLFLGSVGKKLEIQEKFNEDYGKIKSEVNENIYTHYTRPSLPVFFPINLFELHP